MGSKNIGGELGKRGTGKGEHRRRSPLFTSYPFPLPFPLCYSSVDFFPVTEFQRDLPFRMRQVKMRDGL